MTAILWTLVLLAGLGFFAFQLWGRFGVLLKLRRDDGRDYSLATFSKRLKNMVVYGLLQKKFFIGEQPAGIMHVIVFWGFCVLGVQVVTMFARGWFPDFRVPGFGPEHLGGIYDLLKDVFQVAVLFGVGIAFYRWNISKPKRLFGILPAEQRLNSQSHWEAKLILGFISGIMISGFFYDAGRLVALASNPETLDEAKWQPITAYLASLLPQEIEQGNTIAQIAWWIHNLIILTFVNLLPRSKHFHIITAIPNVFLGKIEPKGKLAKKDYSGEAPLFGRSQLPHFTWKQGLDMYSCTECGRCSSVCPAAATGKPLAPRQFLLDLRDGLYAKQPDLLKMTAGSEFDVVVGEGKPVIDDVIWSCVACRACEEACPVNIEYVDKIIEIRQHLTQEASRFPAELNRAFQGMERNSNPWGIAATERAAWAEGMSVPLISEKQDVEYLYYVGCGGSFDASNKSATQSFVKILQEAGVSFAILGKEELCNGESARRLGNEYLYQTMAEALATTINSYGVKKILVNCPHCFNTLKNEYPDFGGKWQVEHAAALVGKLVAEGKIKITEEFKKDVTYHDSCYYGRFNDIYDEPRNLITQIPGVKMEEMFFCKKQGTCCGAGGGRMWMEEQADQRVNIMRTEQALETKPQVIATSCPFCRIMIGSGINEKGVSDQVRVMDVMEMVAQNMKPGAGPSNSPAPGGGCCGPEGHSHT